MSEVLSGKGPQPPSVYWIRRLLVALVAVVAVGVLVWAFLPRNQPTTATPEPAATPVAAASSQSAAPASPSGSPSPSPTTPTDCAANEVLLSVQGFRSAKVDSRQVFSVTAENNTAMTCVLAITPATFVLRVASGNDSIWSTADCDKWLPEVKKQTVKPGGSVEFKVTWALYRSAQGCKQLKTVLRPGTYVATGAYLETSTDQFAFVLTK